MTAPLANFVALKAVSLHRFMKVTDIGSDKSEAPGNEYLNKKVKLCYHFWKRNIKGKIIYPITRPLFSFRYIILAKKSLKKSFSIQKSVRKFI